MDNINTEISKVGSSDSLNMILSAAHDLRSPINSILSLTNLMKTYIQDEHIDREEINKIINLIFTSCNQGLSFTDDLLELSIIGSQEYVLKKEPVEMKKFIKNYISTHRLIALKKKIKVSFNCEIGDDISLVSLNESKITRVLDNVLTNAVKFSKPNSNIDISLNNVDKKMIVIIKDEGVGMSKEVQEHLFVKFGKSQRNGLNGEKSHGLGLSIVKQIMDLHNGSIEVESNEGIGTEVSLIFKE